MSTNLVRFRVTNIALGVGYNELLDALSNQLALDDVVLHGDTLKSDGLTQEAEFELPNLEADLVRGPMRNSRIRFDSTSMVLRFEELSELPPLDFPHALRTATSTVFSSAGSEEDEATQHTDLNCDKPHAPIEPPHEDVHGLQNTGELSGSDLKLASAHGHLPQSTDVSLAECPAWMLAKGKTDVVPKQHRVCLTPCVLQ